jgi:uncharacterized protein with HEPN domain
MYKDRQALDYLNDILESIKDIREFTSGLSCDDFILKTRRQQMP